MNKNITRLYFMDFGLKRFLICLCFLNLIFAPAVYAAAIQSTVKISGKIIDENNVPMIGVTVIQENTSRGTATDFDGNFTLEVVEGSTIVVSYVGYLSQRFENVTEEINPLNITLQSDATNLEEVVIIGYGEQTKQTLVGAVETVEGDKLLKVGSVNSISEALQGQAPGLTVINTNGKPGADAAGLFIRGRSTWRNSSPLVLVDGIERDLNNIDPNEIETISILKDAASTAVYGVRGANGVILITTKRGKLGEPSFNFSANLGIKQPTASPEKADYLTAMQAFNEAAFNDRNYDQLIPQSKIDEWTAHYDERGSYNPYFPEVDWYDKIIGTGYEQTYNLNARGGGETIKYFASLGYRNDGDIFQSEEQPEYDPSFGQKRYNWRTNLDFNITPTTKFTVNFSGNYRVRSQPGYRITDDGDADFEDGFGQPQFFDRIYRAPQNLFPLYYSDGFPGESSDGESNLLVFLNGGGQRKYQYYQGFYDAQLEQKLDFFTKGLSFNGAINYSSASNYAKDILRNGVQGNFTGLNIIRFYRAYDYSKPMVDENGNLTYPLTDEIRWPTVDAQEGPVNANLPSLYGYNRQLNYRFQMKYKRKFDDHNVDATAIMLRQNLVGRNGFAQRREEWIGRLSYNFKKRYLIEASGNYSGSEKFAPGLRFGFFPSVGAAWVISDEPFIKKLTKSWLDFFKVNYSYGIVGNDKVARFQYTQTYGRTGSIPFGYDNLTNYGPQYSEGTIANANATWETSTQQNLKISADLIEKINFEIDLYKSERKDILMERRTVPSFVGFPDLPDANIGRTKSHGYELKVGWNDNLGTDFNYFINFGTSFTENRIVYRDDPAGLDKYLKQAGKPIGWNSRRIAGQLYQSIDDIFNGPNQNNGAGLSNLVPGDILFVDYNGDGVADANDQVPMKDLTYPQRTYNLNLGFTWKNLGFNALLYGVTDVAYNYPGIFYFDFQGGFVQAQPDVLTRWTPQTASTAQKPALHLSDNHNTTNSTLLYKDGSYLRLKNVEINYLFTNDFLKVVGLNTLQLYANGNNIITWSKLGDSVDPETNGSGNYPIVKRYNVGLRATF